MLTSRRCPYLPEVLALLLLPVLALAVAPAAPGGEAAAQVPVSVTAPVGVAVDPPADLESAIARVRSLYFAHDFHHGAAEGDAALERWPESSELAAWTVANVAGPAVLRRGGRSIPLSREGMTAEGALARAESLVASRPDDVWGAIALALALTYHRDRREEALEASLRALELAPTLPEAVWARGVVLHDRRQYWEVATLIEEKWPAVDRQWPELLILKGNAYLAMDSEGPERLAEGLEILAAVRERDPENVNAHVMAGTAVRFDRLRRDGGAALLERAATLSPGSTGIVFYHWITIANHPGLDAEEKQALISAAASELVEQRGQYPGVLREVARGLAELGRRQGLGDLKAEAAALRDRMLAEFAHTVEAELVLADQWNELYFDLRFREVEDRVVARAELSSMLWSFIDRPHHHRAELLGDAYGFLFRHLRGDATVSPDTLLRVARNAVDRSRYPLHAVVASGLAERGVHLDVARNIARDGIDAVEEFHLKSMETSLTTAAQAAERLDDDLANVYAAIGNVELKAGDLVAARDAMNRALELRPNRPDIQFRTGTLAEAEGDVETAEIHYAWGERYERLDPDADKANREALERIHTARHGSMEGYEAFVAGIMERDRDRRWQRVADSRISEPRDLPAIELEWLDGGRIAAEELKGRIVVVNFWGVWCGPCVAEAPQIQQFHEKYRDDPGVAFLTVNNDIDLDMVRRWMEDKEYDYPTLLDDNFATPYGVRAYPTTWFVDQNGQIVFEHVGVSAAVFEEFVWRVEMLKAAAARPAANVPAPALSAAAAQLLHLLDMRVNDEAVELGARLVREHPEDAALHALYVISLAEYRGLVEGMRLSEEFVARWPDNAWVQVARGYVVRDRARTDEALAAAARARQLAPENADIARHVMRIHSAHLRHADAVALADSFITSGRATAGLRAAKASVLWDMASLPGIRDAAAEPLARRELEIALAETPPSVAAYLLAAELSSLDSRADEALPLLEQAMRLSPHSNAVRLAYWRAIYARKDITTDEKQAGIRAAVDAYLEERQHALGATFAVSEYFRGYSGHRDRFNVMTDLIQREHAGTWQAADVAWWRATLERVAALDSATTQADSALAWRQSREPLWQITTMPGANSSVLRSVYSNLFSILAQDSTSSADELLAVIERLEEYSSRPDFWMRHVSLPAALAERGRLDLAEQLARSGLEPMEDDLENGREHWTVAVHADVLDRVKSNYHATIGWVLFHKGDIGGAKRELEKAHETLNTEPTPPYRLGLIAEAEGDIEAAERWYATGRGFMPSNRRSNEALQRLYLARNEPLDGFDAFVEAIHERDVAWRRTKVSLERIGEPEPLPAFEHEWMNGGRFSSESLAGKIAVIHFWGVWCGPCVREAPDIQKFAEKFRDHPDVVFITVANDNNQDVTRDFMKEKGYDFPVIFDEGIVRMAGISAFPTTLFVDREGRIIFRFGLSPRLVEEYTWRVEALLGGPVTDAGVVRPADLERAMANRNDP